MLKLYIRPVCLLRPEEEVASLSLLVESRREKVRTIKGKRKSQQIHCGGTSAPAYADGRTDPLCRRIFWAGRTWKAASEKRWGFFLI